MTSSSRTLVVVQARMGSSRLPGKVLAPVAGAPLLQRMLERVRAARTPFDLVVATTGRPEDDAIVALCGRLGEACFRGHADDLLDRHYQAARAAGASSVVKIPSDCPLVDPAAIDRVLGVFGSDPERYDFVSNLHPPSWPDGNDVEVMRFAALETAWREAQAPWEREHTTPFLWDQPERFRVGNVRWGTGRDCSMSHRFAVDYPEDLAFVQAVFDELLPRRGPAFGVADVLAVLEARPEVFALNARYAGVNWYRHHLGDLKTIGPEDSRPAPPAAPAPRAAEAP
jgi:spore coat polysaccharide biosynthesis protein SpsF